MSYNTWDEKKKRIVFENIRIIGTENTRQLLKANGIEATQASIYQYAKSREPELTQLSAEDIFPNIDGKRINPETGKLFRLGDTRKRDDKVFREYSSGGAAHFMSGKRDPRLTGLRYETWTTIKAWLTKTLLYNSKKRARMEGWDHNLTIDYLLEILPDDWMCPVFKTKMKINGGDIGLSLDRVDNAKGYIQGNVQFISYKANTIKNQGTIKDFEAIIEYMKEFS